MPIEVFTLAPAQIINPDFGRLKGRNGCVKHQ